MHRNPFFHNVDLEIMGFSVMEIHRMEKVGVIYEPYMVRGGTTSIFLVNCTHLGVPVIFI